jgi:hypothetical protein
MLRGIYYVDLGVGTETWPTLHCGASLFSSRSRSDIYCESTFTFSAAYTALALYVGLGALDAHSIDYIRSKTAEVEQNALKKRKKRCTLVAARREAERSHK